MIARLLVLSTLALVPAALSGQAPTARPADVESVDGLITALYETVQRPPGENFDWDRMRSLFHPRAIMVPSTEQRGGSFDVLTPEEFTDWIDSGTTVGGPDDTGFSEEEIARRVERYGDIAQVFSTYRKHVWGSDETLGRGVNTITLVRNGGRWWLMSIAWDEEVGAGPLPDVYLPG